MALAVADLGYQNLLPRLERFKADGLSESNSFLAWFLENVYRLDEVSARDSICDSPNDKGVDGIFVDDANEEIHVIQTKLRQNDKSGGENDLKNLVGTLNQFDSAESVDALLDGGANPDLKSRLLELEVRSKVKTGYSVKGVYVTNIQVDANAIEYASQNRALVIYDKLRIVQEFVDVDQPEGVNGEFVFQTDGEVLHYSAGSNARMYLFVAQGSELGSLGGIADQSLFAQNVRLDLGSTPVNKSIRQSLEDAKSHSKFPLFHNGITLLAEKVEEGDETLTVKNYVVVNGAQSLSSLYRSRKSISSDLKLLLRVVEVGTDRELARQITTVSNNQNAIKPRDQRSNHSIQLRLKSEFDQQFSGQYYYVIKRGEPGRLGVKIENDEAGRWLLAFDVQEPWSTHQIYKIFDDEYSKIFARQQVSAKRIVFLKKIDELISANLDLLDDKKVASYRLTKFFLFYTVRQALDLTDVGKKIVYDPDFALNNWDRVSVILKDMIVGLISDLDDEIDQAGEGFDYKAEFKSPKKVPILASTLIRSYNKDLRRDRVTNPDKELSDLL